MGIPRRAAQRDENEPEIIEALRAAGWGVKQISDQDFPDLVCSKGYRTVLIEVIGPAKFAKYKKTHGLSPGQATYHRAWPGKIYRVRSAEDALRVVGEI